MSQPVLDYLCSIYTRINGGAALTSGWTIYFICSQFLHVSRATGKQAMTTICGLSGPRATYPLRRGAIEHRYGTAPYDSSTALSLYQPTGNCNIAVPRQNSRQKASSFSSTPLN